jgi:hypothetical protein
VVKGRLHPYSDDDPVLLMREPTQQKKQAPNCRTCDAKFDIVRPANYCQWCAHANCSACFTKLKYFFDENPSARVRGKICLLCDRKQIVS